MKLQVIWVSRVPMYQNAFKNKIYGEEKLAEKDRKKQK